MSTNQWRSYVGSAPTDAIPAAARRPVVRDAADAAAIVHVQVFGTAAGKSTVNVKILNAAALGASEGSDSDAYQRLLDVVQREVASAFGFFIHH